MTWEQALVDAQEDLNRAVFEMNKPGQLKPHRRKAERRYVMLCIARAHHMLGRAYFQLENEGVRPFSERQLKQWERKAA